MPDPFARKTYLHAVPDPLVPVRFSVGKRVRALQLQTFFKGLETTAGEFLGQSEGLELIVLTPSDWRRQLSAPYGWGLTRRTEAGVSVALPAGYPPRLVARWDAVRLRAGRTGIRAPGSVPAFLDALLGLEWAHARLLLEMPAKRPKAWLRELSACYLYQRVLQSGNDTYMLDVLKAWARLEQAGAEEPASKELNLEEPASKEPVSKESVSKESGTKETHTDESVSQAFDRYDTDNAAAPPSLQDFLYPRGRMQLPRLLAIQGALWLEAAALAEREGWNLSSADVQRLGKELVRSRLAPL